MRVGGKEGNKKKNKPRETNYAREKIAHYLLIHVHPVPDNKQSPLSSTPQLSLLSMALHGICNTSVGVSCPSSITAKQPVHPQHTCWQNEEQKRHSYCANTAQQ